jgi:hypothetical protein
VSGFIKSTATLLEKYDSTFTQRTFFRVDPNLQAGLKGGADFPMQIRFDTMTFKGTGDTGYLIRTFGDVKNLALTGKVWGEFFGTVSSQFGALKKFDLKVYHDTTVQQLDQGRLFSQTVLGEHLETAANKVGLTKTATSITRNRDAMGKDYYNVSGVFSSREGSFGQNFARKYVPFYEELFLIGGGSATFGLQYLLTTHLPYSLGVATKSLVTALIATVEVGVVGTAAVTGLAIAGAVGAVGWAIEDTRRALNGEKTMTDISTEYWGKRGFGTLSDLWWQIAN